MVKVQNESAIPSGTYHVIIDYSKKFDRLMPLLLSVPGYEGIRIHWGNYAKDTDGCVLVGFVKAKDFIGKSKDAFDSVFHLIQNAINLGDGVDIEITESEE
jgi:hypothetical protein